MRWFLSNSKLIEQSKNQFEMLRKQQIRKNMDNFVFQRMFLSKGSDDRIFQCKHYNRSNVKFLGPYILGIISKILPLSYVFLLENNIPLVHTLEYLLCSVYLKELL